MVMAPVTFTLFWVANAVTTVSSMSIRSSSRTISMERLGAARKV